MVAAPSLQAAIIAQYDFSAPTVSPGNQLSEPASTTFPNTVNTPIVRGGGLTPETDASSINSSGWPTSSIIFGADDYYEFSVGPAPGYVLDLDSIQFGERRSATGVRRFVLLSSVNSFSSVGVNAVLIPDDTGDRDHTLTLPATFNALTSPVTFRLHGFGAEAGTGAWQLRNGSFGGLTVNGSVDVIPEPSTLLLGGVMACVLAGGRRFRSAGAAA
jgi:hypothetical protein